jgi:hypothetical protein
MAKMKMEKPADKRSMPNPPLRAGTGTMNMAKAMIKGNKKKK